VRERTLLVERALTGDGEFKGQKTRQPPRTVDLLAPLRQDLAAWELRQGRPGPSALIFANAVVSRGRSTTAATGAGAPTIPPPKRSGSSARGPTTCATASLHG
jgi:hypothetical protein